MQIPARYFLAACFIILSTASVWAQPYATRIKTRALEMSRLLVAGDYTAYVAYMHPKLRASEADQSQIRAALDSVDKYRKQFGIKVSKVVLGNPTPVVRQGEVLQSALLQTTTLQSVMGSITTENAWIAFSEDGGTTWYFADAASYEQLRKHKDLPLRSRKLQIPTIKPPQITPAAGLQLPK